MIVLSEMICPSVTIDFKLFRLLCFLLSISDITLRFFIYPICSFGIALYNIVF